MKVEFDPEITIGSVWLKIQDDMVRFNREKASQKSKSTPYGVQDCTNGVGRLELLFERRKKNIRFSGKRVQLETIV
jgi:hypothetical protein